MKRLSLYGHLRPLTTDYFWLSFCFFFWEGEGGGRGHKKRRPETLLVKMTRAPIVSCCCAFADRLCFFALLRYHWDYVLLQPRRYHQYYTHSWYKTDRNVGSTQVEHYYGVWESCGTTIVLCEGQAFTWNIQDNWIRSRSNLSPPFVKSFRAARSTFH